jgi:hypothetical protein
MFNTANYHIKKNDIKFNEDGIPIRRYLNDDPGCAVKIDRPTYEYLSIDEEYTGYRDMVWSPIDLPILDIDMDQIATLAEDPDLQKNFYVTKNTGSLIFLKPNQCGMAGEHPDWFDFAKEELGHVVDYIENLPFETIHQAFFVQAPSAIPAHYDEELGMAEVLKLQAPSHLHFRWSKVTDWREEHFYMTKNSDATQVYPMLPPETNAFAYDGAVYEHGVNRGFDMRDRVQLVVHGVYDMPKWHKLLEKSWNRYKEYAITTEHFDL